VSGGVPADRSALARTYGEYASRLVERNVPLAQVRDLLGHASIVTTERYDNQTLKNLQNAAARLEDGKTFDATPRDTPQQQKTAGNSARSHVLSSFCQDLAEPASKSPADNEPTTDANCFEDRNLESWYAYGPPVGTRSWRFSRLYLLCAQLFRSRSEVMSVNTIVSPEAQA
jgi:hypothetical protein